MLKPGGPWSCVLKQELPVGCTLLQGSAEKSEPDTDTLQLDTHENERAELKEIKQLFVPPPVWSVKNWELHCVLKAQNLKGKTKSFSRVLFNLVLLHVLFPAIEAYVHQIHRFHNRALSIPELQCSQPLWASTFPRLFQTHQRSAPFLFLDNHLPYSSRPFCSIHPFTSSCLGGVKATNNRGEVSVSCFMARLLPANKAFGQRLESDAQGDTVSSLPAEV